MKKSFWWLILVSLVIGILSILIWWWQRPTVGKIKTTEVKTETNNQKKEYRGEYLDFDYEDIYEVGIDENLAENQLEKISLLGKKLTAEKIMIIVSKTKEENLSELSAWQMRDRNSDYEKIEGGFQKKDDTEISQFKVGQGKYVSMVMTVGVKNEDSENRFWDLLKTIRYKDNF